MLTNLGMDDCAACGISQNSVLTRRVNFFDSCSLSEEISTCDNYSETPSCLTESEEVSKVQLFTASSTAGNVAEYRSVDFCHICVF